MTVQDIRLNFDGSTLNEDGDRSACIPIRMTFQSIEIPMDASLWNTVNFALDIIPLPGEWKHLGHRICD